MHTPLHHAVFLERTLSTGQEVWSCPTCGRRFLLQWPPAFKKTILVPGDESVAHCGTKDTPDQDLMLIADPANLQAAAERDANDQPSDHGDHLPPETLAPWLDWLQQVAFVDQSVQNP